MKKSFFAGVLISGLLAGAAFAADQKFNGVLIDAKCGKNQMKKDDPEAAAAGHPKACAIKCGKDGDMALISGKEMLKLDDAGKTKAMEYLAKNDSTKVTIEGTKDGDTLKVSSIEAAK
ncbi:MAG TPA: hypothetical protein VH475_21565 [Tepidisphaeraceae bacterium]|jgi:hypothetical protein